VKFRLILVAACSAILAGCAQKDTIHTMRVSVPDQKMVVYRKGVPIATYQVSTSKFGLGDRRGSYRTPLGRMEVAKKIGGGAPIGMKFKSRRPTGEIVKIDAPGRDPIVTRILWLKGLERQNGHAFGRGIYIHGTAEERNIGRPVSYGCIRMRSRDVIDLYNTVGVGARVEVTRDSIVPRTVAQQQPAAATPAPASRAKAHARTNGTRSAAL
jgi:lipoprotein-anchoring transpeptidase ErfK/SrfK